MDLDLMRRLATPTESKIVLLVMDGLGGLPNADGQTELEAAMTPNLDALAAASELGLSRPVAAGVTPGSGPAHLGLFGYDPIRYEVGRGVLSALGVGFELGPNDLAARLNFATKGADGTISDRRAGRIQSDRARELVERLNEQISLDGAQLFVLHEKEHRAVAILRAEGLSDALSDTDPQKEGLKPLAVEATGEEAKKAAALANSFVEQADEVLKDSHPANTILMRGFGMHPSLPEFDEIYALNAAAIASYPMYKGLARLAGMKVLTEGEGITGEFGTLAAHWEAYDFFFIHIKQTDSSGEDGDFERKAKVIEEVDSHIPRLLDLQPDVVAVTGDHATPARMLSHSWHGVPFLVHSPYVLPTAHTFGERSCAGGSLGAFPAQEIMGLLMGHALKLARYGA